MGHGVRAKQHICKNSLITRYHGVAYKEKAEVLKIEKAMEENNAPPGDYIFHWKNVLYVDATAVDGSLGRLINHSHLNPNAAAKEYTIQTGTHAGKRAIVMRAKKCIPPGAQIFYAYGEMRPEQLRIKPWQQSQHLIYKLKEKTENQVLKKYRQQMTKNDDEN